MFNKDVPILDKMNHGQLSDLGLSEIMKATFNQNSYQ